VAWNAAGKRKLLEQALHAFGVLADVRVNFAVAALQPGIGHHTGSAVAGAADIDHIQVALADNAVEMRVDKVEAGRGAPVSQQARLDMFRLKRFAQQRVRHQVNLPDGKVVGGAPVAVQQA